MDFVMGDSVVGDFVRRILSFSIVGTHKIWGILSQVKFSLGDFFMGNLSRGILSLGDFVTGDFVTGDFVMGDFDPIPYVVCGIWYVVCAVLVLSLIVK